jgi:glyoxylase-like metal-dependent hydrolase (beta-lactamase superfamily II)
MRSLLAPLALVLSGAAAAQQQDFSKVTVNTVHAGGVVSMLEGAGGNVGVSVGPDGVLMIDTQFPGMREKLVAAIAALQQPGTPRFVVNTHWHMDHTQGNAGLARLPDGGLGAVVIAQEAVRQRMQDGSQGQAAAPPEALPVITFANDVTLHLNGEDIRVLHMPHGHTDGDSALLFPVSKVAHLGDLFFNKRFPFVDLSSGGDVLGLQRDIAQLVPQIGADWKIIPGHGPLATLDELKLYQRMLDESIRTVKEALAKGQTREQILAAGLPAEWQGWAWEFISADRWLGTVYDSLKAAPDGPPAGR